MATDILILGPLVFDDWSTPARLPFGGKQAMAVHKLPGGARVVDTLGPDEDDIKFTGMFWGSGAYASAQILDGMRVAGQVVPLMFAGRFYQVIVQEAIPVIERFPNYCTYSVTCLVVFAPMLGALGAAAASIGAVVGADMATVMSVAGL
jgi:hypothetical protein